MATAKKFLLKERRRAARINGKLPVTLVLRRGRQGEIVVASSPGEILDISLYGAGLAVEQIRVESSHFFYSPQDNPSYVLHLQVQLPSEDESDLESISIPVRPVRFDRIIGEGNEPKPFHLGVEFLADSTDEQVSCLFRLVGDKNKGKGWWRTVVDSFFATDGDK